ncbi:Ger(x)C family spore germination protein, partial [Senegalia sp. (in: firmicutes)]
MKKKIILLLIIIISINLITGCWDKRELSELSIASAIGIDRVEDEYLVSVQIINPSEVTG